MRQHSFSRTAAPERAATAAAAAALRADVELRELSTPAATAGAERLFCDVWQTSTLSAPVSSDLMRALEHSGNYVAGAYRGDRLVGASVAFFTDDSPVTLHSHIAGVDRSVHGRHVGFALKLHQRAWALARGIGSITWTMDPLVRRNLYFNLAKLGAEVAEYLPDHYGRMRDGINADDRSDRLLLAWPLAADRVHAAAEGTPCPVNPGEAALLLAVGPDGAPEPGVTEGSVLICQVPADIVAVRAADPVLGAAWRQALSAALTGALAAGYRVVGVNRQGDYVLAK
jgi:predicted GNAT superfamily acetyltransferase